MFLIQEQGETLMANNMEANLKPKTWARTKLEMNIKVVFYSKLQKNEVTIIEDSSGEEDAHFVDQQYLRTEQTLIKK